LIIPSVARDLLPGHRVDHPERREGFLTGTPG
jgi:hypothetical protein